MDAFCNPNPNVNITADDEAFALQIKNMKRVFVYAQIIFCLIGVFGNILNLRTLQSPSLQTVPFMYIRALAVFDLISLSAIILHFMVETSKKHFILMFYVTYIEAPLINSFLIAGLYCAFTLTIERYLLLVHPHFKPSQNPKQLARKRIAFMLFCATLLHLPMILQTKLKFLPNGTFSPVNNIDMLCREPHWSIFKYYKMGRECLRFFCVIIMTVLNVVIARKLQLTKINRRRLVKRSNASELALNNLLQAPNGVPSRKSSSTSPEPNMGANNSSKNKMGKREYTHLIKSFAEKKLTVLMIAICLIYIVGNVPQMFVMVLQNEAMETVFGFQLYRNIANLLEVLNHCLNFYVFCMASSEYTRAFLLNCLCLRTILLRYPAIAQFINTRRVSSMFGTNSVSMVNRDMLSQESIQAESPSINDEAPTAMRRMHGLQLSLAALAIIFRRLAELNTTILCLTILVIVIKHIYSIPRRNYDSMLWRNDGLKGILVHSHSVQRQPRVEEREKDKRHLQKSLTIVNPQCLRVMHFNEDDDISCNDIII